MAEHIIEFQPLGRRGTCGEGQSLSECARRLGIGINNVCGGTGTCHACKVRMLAGTLSEPTAAELDAFLPAELGQGWRLACQACPQSDCTVAIPAESMTTPQRTQVEGLETAVEPEPPVRGYEVSLSPPSLSDQQADANRLVAALAETHGIRCRRIDLAVLKSLSPALRSWQWRCRASVRGDEMMAVGAPEGRSLGMAVDLGTTKIAAYLVDLTTGRTLASRGMMNPQIECGEDVVTRISYITGSSEGQARMQALAVGAINQLAAELCSAVQALPGEILEMVVVGNTALHHFFLGLPVAQLVLSPFCPAVSGALDVRARDIGLDIAPGAYVHLLPNIAGFVGADHVAMLLGTGAWQRAGPVIAIDIGTNTEVSLVHEGRITSASCASGPAFEGGHIRDGMRAASGAIERLRVVTDTLPGGRVQYQTVDDAPPAGICGSGILDTLAQLHLSGVVNPAGRMVAEHPLVRGNGRQREFVIVGPEHSGGHRTIGITQMDIRELQLAKAAIRTGIQVLLNSHSCAEEDVQEVVIAGAFGSYIDVASAIAVGMLPPLPLDRFRQVGNAAGTGARLALVSVPKREEACEIASRVHYLELASSPGFMQTFTEATHLGRYRLVGGARQELA